MSTFFLKSLQNEYLLGTSENISPLFSKEKNNFSVQIFWYWNLLIMSIWTSMFPYSPLCRSGLNIYIVPCVLIGETICKLQCYILCFLPRKQFWRGRVSKICKKSRPDYTRSVNKIKQFRNSCTLCSFLLRTFQLL